MKVLSVKDGCAELYRTDLLVISVKEGEEAGLSAGRAFGAAEAQVRARAAEITKVCEQILR